MAEKKRQQQLSQEELEAAVRLYQSTKDWRKRYTAYKLEREKVMIRLLADSEEFKRLDAELRKKHGIGSSK